MTYRTLKVYGQFISNTVIRVTVDDAIVKDGIVNGELYSFVTSTSFHGKATVKIEVLSGQITLGDVTATYPAQFNRTVEGTVTFRQPVLNPFVVLIDNEPVDIDPRTVTLSAGESFEYDHLMFNGPTKFLVRTDDNIEDGYNVSIGDFLTKESVIGRGINTQFDYEWLDFEMGNAEDEIKLKNFIYKNIAW